MYNDAIMTAIRVCVHMDNLMEKDPMKWVARDDEFYKGVLTASEDFYNGKHSIALQPGDNNTRTETR